MIIEYTHKGIRRKKTVKIDGRIIGTPKRGTYISQLGTKIHGIKIEYIKSLKNGAGKGGRIRKRPYVKVIAIPPYASNLKIRK